MKRMLKPMCVLFVCALFLVPCRAADVIDILPDEVAEKFDGLQSDSSDTGELVEFFSFGRILGWIKEATAQAFPSFTRFILSILGYVLFFSIVDKFALVENKSSLSFVLKCCINAALLLYLFGFFSKSCTLIKQNLETIQVFCKASVPVMTALLIESGKSFSASLFSYSVSLCSVLLTTLSSNILLPLIHIFISIGSCGLLWDDLHFASITDLIKKIIKWIIGGVFSVFTFSLSVQSILTKSADNVTRKALKTAASSIPVLGSVLSEGLDGTFTLISGTKTVVAAIGIAAIVMLFIGPATHLGMQYGALCIALSVSELFDQKDCLAILKVAKDAYILLFGLFLVCVLMCVVCFLIMCIGAN